MSEFGEEKVRVVLKDAITSMCRNSMLFQQQLNIQGLLAVTVDAASVVILQMNEVMEKTTDGSISITSATPDRRPPCECCCKCRSPQKPDTPSPRPDPTHQPEQPPPPQHTQIVTIPKVNLVAPSAGPHLIRQNSPDASQIAQSLVTLADPVKPETTTDRDKLRETLGIVHLPPESKSPDPTGPFVAGVASKSAKVVNLTPATVSSATRTEFQESQLASFASLAHDINLGSAAEIGVAWYHSPGIQFTPVTEVGRSSSQERVLTQVASTNAISIAGTSPKPAALIPEPQPMSEVQLSTEEKKAIRAEKARLYRMTMRSSPALKQKYEEVKRKNRERMQRHRMLMNRSSKQQHQTTSVPQFTYQVTGATASAAGTQIKPRTAAEDSKLWHDIHTWQTQPLGLAGVTPLVTHALQTQQMLIPASVVETATTTLSTAPQPTTTPQSIAQTTTATGIK